MNGFFNTGDILPSQHDAKRQVRHDVQHEDGDLVICQVLEIQACNILRIDTEHPAVDSGYRPFEYQQRNRTEYQHQDIDHGTPAKKDHQ